MVGLSLILGESSEFEPFTIFMSTTKHQIDKDYLPYFEYMLSTLKNNHLSVVVTNRIRQAQNQNCNWYRIFCSQHLLEQRSWRHTKLRIKINRRTTIKSLTTIVTKRWTRSEYYEEYLEIAKELEAQNMDYIDM